MSIKDKIKTLSAETVERPHRLEADVESRYTYAQKHCKGKDVLDIGCGFGLGTNIISKVAKSVLGIDYSSPAVKSANKNKSKNVKYKTLDAQAINKIKQKFDTILCFEIIEHLKQEEGILLLEKMHQMLKKDGILLLSTPNGNETNFFLGKPHNPYHIKEYKPNEIKDMVDKFFKKSKIFGFKCINKKYIKSEETIEKTVGYKIAYILGHFKTVREVLGYIPRGLKRNVTKESDLPMLKYTDFVVDEKIGKSRGLFIIAQK